MRKWRVDDSAELYNIEGWGAGFFGVDQDGNVAVMPHKNPDKSISIKKILDELSLKDISCPVLLRFPDIIDDRIDTIFNCFENASKEYNFHGGYSTVFPIKVNQQQPVVEEIANYGKKYNIGLEAGSKPELHAVLATMDNPEGLIICNGYKDEEFIELALLAKKMGKNVFLVAEKFNELKNMVKLSKVHNVDPNIGIRIKLAAFGSGKWEESGGDKSKFGLTPNELIEAIEYMKSENMLNSIRLIHCHLGSQITNIRKIKRCLREAAQFFVQLRKLGCNIQYVDIGGGLGVDYDGTRSTFSSSTNYSIQEYANDAVSAIQDAADKNGFPHPHIISESGRALTAHHSVLVFNVLETTCPPRTPYEEFEITENDHEIVKELHNILDSLTDLTMVEAWHDAVQMREEALDLFSLGMLDLDVRAKVDKLFWSIAYEIRDMAHNSKHPVDDISDLENVLAEKYFCNFSLFQSLPDNWAIDQMFPIMPLQRLDEKPTHSANLQDITCDSDGKISRFIGNRGFQPSLPLHSLKTYEPYYIGVFLVGAYQEILGDMHNLFGDTNIAHIIQKDDGSFEIDKIIEGETVSDVLYYVQYHAKKLVRSMENWVSTSIKEGKITPTEGKNFLANYSNGLYGYTYLEE